MVKRLRRWLPGPKHGVARGVAVYGSPGYARDAGSLNAALGQWPALRSWAEGRGLSLRAEPENLRLLDQEIAEELHRLDQEVRERPDDKALKARHRLVHHAAGEAGKFLGTVIISNAAGARWRVWPNGHPVIVTGSGRELDVAALANRRFSTGGPSLADVYDDAVRQ